MIPTIIVLMTKRKFDSIVEDIKRIKFYKMKESSQHYEIIENQDIWTFTSRLKLICAVIRRSKMCQKVWPN